MQAVIAESVQKPSEEQFEAFYSQYVALVHRVLSRLPGNYGSDLDDLTQETFLKAWRAYHRIDGIQNITAWIVRIAQNVGRDFLRYKRVHYQFDCPLDDDIVGLLPDEHLGAQAIYSGENDAITRAFERLCPDDQKVILLLMKEYTRTEIAEALEMDKVFVQGRVKRARRRFQKRYSQDLG